MNLRTYLESNDITQAAFAARLGVTQGLVWQWLAERTTITAERAIQIEAATDGHVHRHELRPDLYPRDEAAA
ncbi:MAG: transcriptional regulator [Vicinamibacterales bacterium]